MIKIYLFNFRPPAFRVEQSKLPPLSAHLYIYFHNSTRHPISPPQIAKMIQNSATDRKKAHFAPPTFSKIIDIARSLCYDKQADQNVRTAISTLEKYPRGRRGSPAKGVVRVNRSQGSNPCFSAKLYPTEPVKVRLGAFFYNCGFKSHYVTEWDSNPQTHFFIILRVLISLHGLVRFEPVAIN